MTPVGVTVHCSENAYFPHLEQYYPFEVFERLAALSSQQEDLIEDHQGERPPTTSITVHFDNGKEVGCNLFLWRDGALGAEDALRTVIINNPEDFPHLQKVQWTTH